MLLRELKRLFQSPLSYCCVLIYTGIMLLGIFPDLNTKTSQGWFEKYWLTENYGVSCLITALIFPIAVASVCYEERRGGYDWLVVMRTGCRRYCLVKSAAACAGSVLLYLLSVLLFVCIGSVIDPGLLANCTGEALERYFQGAVWAGLAKDYGYWASFLLFVLLNALSIGIFGSLTVCLSVYSTNRYVICAFPFVIERLGGYVGGVLDRWHYIPSVYASGTGTIRQCILRSLAAYAVLGGLYLWEWKWRRRHG